MKPILSLVILLFILLISCGKDEPVVLKSADGFPQRPVNISFSNSRYDDYNSSIYPGTGENDLITFVFSTNRNSKGKDFDFIVHHLSMVYFSEKNELTVKGFNGKTNRGGFVSNYLPTVNTPNNEFGPFMMDYHHNQNTLEDYLFFYTQEEDNRCRLKFYKMEWKKNLVYTDYEVSVLNDDNYNIGYLTIQNNKMYYNCDKEGNYDIYELAIDTTMDIVDFLTQPSNLQSRAKKIVSSDAEDKCPFVVGDFMAFTSKREGGQGGFDLWYSKRNGDSWAEPVNFGPSVNSPGDEYRPVVSTYKRIPNDLMIFSSNRSGGHGGFDLYYVGITQAKDQQ